MRWPKQIVAAWLVLALAPAARAEERITFGHVGAVSPVVWPIYIAMSQGFFANAGIALEPIFAPSSAAVMQQLVAGAITIGDSGIVDPIRAVDQGAPVAILMIEAEPAPYVLVAKPAIATIAGLKGKTISAGGPADITSLYMERMAAAGGLGPHDYDIVPAGSTSARFAALQSGAADAAVLIAPLNFRAEALGFRRLAIASDYVKDIPFTAYEMGRAWAGAHGDSARRFRAAYLEGVAWFYDPKNRAAAIEIMVGASHADRDDTAKSYDFFRAIGFFERTGKVAKSELKAAADVLRRRGEISQGFDVDKLVLPGVTELSRDDRSNP
jgi:NitT/TauT family transport system substrate-binding protein